VESRRAACDNRAMPAALRVLLAGALFATGGALIKSCGFPSLQRSGLRALFAAVAIFVMLPASRRWPDRHVLRVLPAYFVATCFFVVANTLTTAANTIFLQSTAPLWVLVLGPLLLGERNSRRDVLTFAGIAVGMTLCFVAPNEATDTAPDPRLGDALALLAGVGFAGMLLGMRWLSRIEPSAGAAVVAWGNVATAPLSFALMPFVDQTPVVGTGGDWLVIAFLGVFQVGLAYVVLVRAIPHVPAVRASLLLMIEPALNPLIAFAVHDERPHALTIAGGGLILGSVAASSLRRRAPRRA